MFLPEPSKIMPVASYNDTTFRLSLSFFFGPRDSSVQTHQSLKHFRVNTVYDYFSNDISQFPNI